MYTEQYSFFSTAKAGFWLRLEMYTLYVSLYIHISYELKSCKLSACYSLDYA